MRLKGLMACAGALAFLTGCFSSEEPLFPYGEQAELVPAGEYLSFAISESAYCPDVGRSDQRITISSPIGGEFQACRYEIFEDEYSDPYDPEYYVSLNVGRSYYSLENGVYIGGYLNRLGQPGEAQKIRFAPDLIARGYFRGGRLVERCNDAGCTFGVYFEVSSQQLDAYPQQFVVLAPSCPDGHATNCKFSTYADLVNGVELAVEINFRESALYVK